MKKEYKYTINGNKYEVAIGEIVDNIATLTVNGEEFKVEMEPLPKPLPRREGRPSPVSDKQQESDTVPSQGGAGTALKSPLPGVITDILVEVGQEVQAGDNVIVLEAMKMANNLQAEKSGKVTAICVKVGQSVMEDEALVIIE
jgi:biotin carboxyl carrier protein